MIQDETIVCISPTSWFDIWRNRQQVMSRLAKQNRIIFVQPSDKKNVNSNIPYNIDILFTPWLFPFMSRFMPESILQWTTPLIVKLNNFILCRFLKRKLYLLGIVEPILWIYDPLYVGLIGHINEKLSCWHVHDEISEFPFNRKITKTIYYCEKLLGENVSLIFASSKYQYNKRRVYGEKVHYIPNACDFQHFNKARIKSNPIPADISHLRSPIIGYYGGLHFTIDINLIVYVANSHPEWTIILIGRDDLMGDKNLTKIQMNNNVHCLDMVDYRVLPNYVRMLDVVIFPYTLNSTLYASPLKLFECLAAGKAIVSTPLPELVPLEGLIWIAHSNDEFVTKVEQAIKEKDNPERIKRGMVLAQENEWDQRVEQMSALIEGVLHNRGDH